MSLIVHGEDVLERPEIAELLCDVTVRSWDDHGLRFTNAEGGIRKLRRKPSIFTLHWTGGDGGGPRVFRVLKNRKTKDGRGLSVQLFLDAAGVVWQFADLADRARHASATNRYGPGLEIQGRGLDRTGAVPQAQDEVIHGRTHRVVPFTEAQQQAAVALAKAVCVLFDMPWRAPGAGADVFSGLLTTAEIRKFHGVLGHLHVSRRKLDPGLGLFRRLLAEGFAPAPLA